ncbi:MAG: SDR family oxidoreductase [Candidatus Levybacteria bacterium]|nr:SDR family oxidoreductase [Candidatus Levybacteria bacterium]
MKILGTGLTGLVGSRLVELLGDKYEFENLSRSTGVDIVNKENVLEKIKSSDAQIVLHMAAKTDVDGCEKDKTLGEAGEAWKINVEGTRNVADACLETNKKLIYISTDFVFDGEKNIYVEDDIPNPINWYGATKYEGEKIVKVLETPWIIARIAYPYRANFPKVDFARAILKRLKEGFPVMAVVDHIFTPTLIDDIALGIEDLIQNNGNGIFHVVGSQSLSPYDACFTIAKEFNLDDSRIAEVTRTEFFNNRACRPFQLALKNDRIAKLGIKMHTFEEGIREIKKQMFH